MCYQKANGAAIDKQIKELLQNGHDVKRTTYISKLWNELSPDELAIWEQKANEYNNSI